MCWSATADLAAGSVITAAGLTAVAGVRRVRDLPMAALPVILGAHQLIESVVWRGTEGEVSASVAQAARTAWAIIAFPLLPLYVPLAVLAAVWPVRGRARAVTLWVCTAIGAFASGMLAYAMARHPVQAHVHGHTVGYSVGIPAGNWVIGAYLVAALVPLLVCGDRMLRVLGVVCAVGAAVCAVIWTEFFASTWCALAAAAALVVVAWVWGRRRSVRGGGGQLVL